MSIFDDISFEIYLEKSVVVLLRSGRYIYGVLKSYDQYNTIVLNYSIERIFHELEYAEKKHGLIVLRSDSISYIGLCSSTDFGQFKIAPFSRLENEFITANKLT